ncbi:MAG TPA: acyl-CoA dehydrogenase family protein [Acidimicrobiales bacterium]|nr:acyl-CoA dehydrogenase family protein [Acidimicrobiales bacterium]
MSFEIPEHIRSLRDAVRQFMIEFVEPAEATLHREDEAAATLLFNLQSEAKQRGLWALGHPSELGGGGMSFLDYVYVNEVQGRSSFGQFALGSFTLQDTLLLQRHGSSALKERWLRLLVDGKVSPSFSMTEPDVSSSDPTQLATSATLEGDEWVLNGRKWFATGAARAGYVTVMCRTETDVPARQSFSIILVPAQTPGFTIVRETPVLGLRGGHYEIDFDSVRVPHDHLLGVRGEGFAIAQERLGPGRIFHCMRWLGQAQRAFDLMCERLNSRVAFGERLAAKQLMQQHVFESFAEIQACRLLTLQVARQLDAGEEARVEIGTIKVVGARMLHNVVDRALQVYGAAGLTDDTPLSVMYREARFARIYDGPDEVHVQSVARRLLKRYDVGESWEIGLR